MHTDEYEISLSRELGVCDGYIKKYQRVLREMEKRYGLTTAIFIDHRRNGSLPEASEFIAWQRAFKSMQRWSAVRSEYWGLLEMMKGSAES
jgi:hypothetical protein